MPEPMEELLVELRRGMLSEYQQKKKVEWPG
jgi:hypothetical protein